MSTLTSSDTTYHTNTTVFNPKNENDSAITQEIIDGSQEKSRSSTSCYINNYNDYKIGKLSPPPVIGCCTDKTNRDQLDYRLSVDCAKTTGTGATSLETPFTQY